MRLRLVVCLLAIVARPSAAAAQPNSNRSASVLVFPKVIADGDRDTVIQITNVSNAPRRALCIYVNAALLDPTQPPGPSNPRLWSAIDFSIRLTRQQPTYWVASQGRVSDDGDAMTGFDPGPVPPTPDGFTGELLCAEVDDSGAPIGANALVGVATLDRLGVFDSAKYNAFGLQADEVDPDPILCLGGGAGCPAEYSGCPQRVHIDHLAEGAEDPVAGAGSTTSSRLTVLPCAQDFTGTTPTSTFVTLLSVDEFELMISAAFSVEGWADLALTDISPGFDTGLRGSTYLQMQVVPGAASPSCVALLEETRDSGGAGPAARTTVIGNPQFSGERTGERILLPILP